MNLHGAEKPLPDEGGDLKATDRNPILERELSAADLPSIATQDRRDVALETPGVGALPPYVPPMPLHEGGLCDWIASARPGAAIEYHQGFLLLDRSEVASDLPAKERARLHAVARRAWIACELGLVHLFSVKVAEARYRYLAVRSKTSVPLSGVQDRLGNKKAVRVPRNSH